MEIITQGKACRADEALKVGLLDAIVETDQLLESAINTVSLAANEKLDWQLRRKQKTSALSLSKLEAMMSFTMAKGLVAQKQDLITQPQSLLLSLSKKQHVVIVMLHWISSVNTSLS